MRAKLNKTELGRLERQGKLAPQGAPFDVRDTELKGLLLRVQPTGKRTWFYQYRTPQGRQTRLKLGDHPGLSPDGARGIAMERATEAAAGVDLVGRKRNAVAETKRLRLSTLRAFLDGRYKPWAQAHLKSWKMQIERIESDFADWLDKPMHEMVPFAIEGLRQRWKREGLSPKSINRDIQRLQSVLSRAVDWGVLDRHPFEGLKPLKTDKTGRVRYLSPKEEQSLRDALIAREWRICTRRATANKWRSIRGRELLPALTGDYVDYLRPMVLLALNTGLRRGEIFGLTWGRLDLTGKMLTVIASSTKSGQTRNVPLNTEALDVLNAWKQRNTQTGAADFVFTHKGKALRSVNFSWPTTTEAAGLIDFHFHDLRHHFASRLVMAGVDLNTVRELLGHSEIKMTLRYAHLAPDGLARAVQMIAATARSDSAQPRTSQPFVKSA